MRDVKWWNPSWVGSAGNRPSRPFHRGLLTAILVLTILLIAGSHSTRRSTADTDLPFFVAMRAIDPTTVEVAFPGGGFEQVRMIGIDPVGPVLPGQDTGCLAGEAKRFIQTRLPPGSPLVLVADPTQPDRDTDRRLLRHVIIYTDPNAPVVPDAVPNPMVRAPMNLAYLLVSGGLAQVRALPNPSIYTPQLRVAQETAREEGTGVWSPTVCGSSPAPDGHGMNPDEQAVTDPRVLLPITVPELELPPAVRALLGDSPAIDAALGPGRAAVATTIAAANSSMATTFAVLTAIPTIAATRGEPGQARPIATVTPPPIPLPTPEPPEE